ncbi:MAG: hypothetical protein KDD66_11050 [Bdellovibrionales bacterium]|nr:hypothetical protein [Bdellovibrionales bacterium]
MNLFQRIFFICLLVLTATACSREELIDNLSQRESIEVLSLLNQSGIHAERQKNSRGSESKYTIYVSNGDKQQATDVLHRYGFPREVEESVESLTRQHGFVPNPAQLNEVRLDRALAAELERLLGAVSGVVDAKVIVRSNLATDGDESKPRASVVVRYVSSAGKQPFTDDQVREMVANSVPGLSADSVTVSVSRIFGPGEGGSIMGSDRINPLETLEPFEFQVPNSQRSDAQRQVALLAVVFAAVGLVLGIGFGWSAGKRRTERALRRLSGPAENDNFFIESGSPKKPGKLTGGSQR